MLLITGDLCFLEMERQRIFSTACFIIPCRNSVYSMGVLRGRGKGAASPPPQIYAPTQTLKKKMKKGEKGVKKI